MPRPRFSIVIPSLNQAAYLERALRSVLEQQYPDLELIVMDGGSTDGSVALIRKYETQLAHWTSAKDDGPADALNRGFARATGELLGFLNADDFYLPGALEQVSEAFAASPSADVVSGHGYFATPAGELGAPAYSDAWDLRRFQYGACVLLQPATFFRRTAFERTGGFRRTGRVCWDMELWADLASTGSSFQTLDRFIAAFRLHPNSVTGNAQHHYRRRRDARQVMAEMRGRPEDFRDRLAHAFFRGLKFGRHPIRSLTSRKFCYSTLRRWSL